MATQMLIAPYYRLYELPWSPTESVERRFRVVVRNVLIVFLIFGLAIPFLPMSERLKMQPSALSERVVKLVIEKKLTPPPPKKEEPKPEVEKPKPVEKPKLEPPKDDARKKAQQAVKVFDAFAELRDAAVLDKAQQTKNLTNATGEQTRSERNMLLSKVGVGSGGINNANLSRGYGGGSGSLNGRDTTQVSSTLGAADGRSETRHTSGSGKSARGREEVAMVFDRNKGAIYSIYTRALRENPNLKGKVVFELTISPTGEILNCKLVSSELNDPELEKKLIARIKLFRFDARDVEVLTVTEPIDFLPTG